MVEDVPHLGNDLCRTLRPGCWRWTIKLLPLLSALVLMAYMVAVWGGAQYRSIRSIVAHHGSVILQAAPFQKVLVDKETWGDWHWGVPLATLLLPAESVFLGPRCKNADIRSLEPLHFLVKLTILRLQVSKRGMQVVGQLHTLQSLIISGADIGDRGIISIEGLTRLRRLDLDDTNVDGKVTRFLVAFANLRRLSLAGDDIKNADLRELVKLRKLKSLDLAYTHISDTGLRWVRQMPGLQMLILTHTQCTRKGIAALLRRKPGLRVRVGML